MEQTLTERERERERARKREHLVTQVGYLGSEPNSDNTALTTLGGSGVASPGSANINLSLSKPKTLDWYRQIFRATGKHQLLMANQISQNEKKMHLQPRRIPKQKYGAT